MFATIHQICKILCKFCRSAILVLVSWTLVNWNASAAIKTFCLSQNKLRNAFTFFTLFICFDTLRQFFPLLFSFYWIIWVIYLRTKESSWRERLTDKTPKKWIVRSFAMRKRHRKTKILNAHSGKGKGGQCVLRFASHKDPFSHRRRRLRHTLLSPSHNRLR